MLMPLNSGWTLTARGLIPVRRDTFSLPGADLLSDFADLLGGDADTATVPPQENGIPMQLPALLPDTAQADAVLSRAIDFGAWTADSAFLSIGLPIGKGRIFLDDQLIAAFDHGRMKPPDPNDPGTTTLDVTDVLRHGRCKTLSVRFDSARPAGISGPIFLRLSRFARIEQVCLVPDAEHRLVRITARLRAKYADDFVLRAFPVLPADSSVSDGRPTAFFDAPCRIGAGESKVITLDVPLDMAAFKPGKPYASATLKLLLLKRQKQEAFGPTARFVCDERTLTCGFGGEPAPYDLPLTRELCFAPPKDLLEHLAPLALHGVVLPAPAPNAFIDALARAGYAVRQITGGGQTHVLRLSRFPHVTLQTTPEMPAPAPCVCAWQLCAMVPFDRTPPADSLPEALLAEAAGREIPTDIAADTLHWLRVVQIRLRAEAARQGRLMGALCASGEWQDPYVWDALQTALAPIHLSALPLSGAWWCGSHFCAALHFFTNEAFSAPPTAVAILENEDGHILAQTEIACPRSGGSAGMLECTLPDSPCVLTLHTQLLSGKDVIEQSQIPIYVGARGMLEAAF